MNWLKNFVRPKLRELVGGQKEVPENLWHKCGSCGQMIFHRDLEKYLHVCHHCGHHMRLGATGRLNLLFDEDGFEIIMLPKAIIDPLKFRDLRRYSDRLKDARAKTGDDDALKVGFGKIKGNNVVIAALDFSFMGGSMGLAVGEGLLIAAREAVSRHAPLVVVPSSGGARMQEGIHSLMQLARTTIAVDEVKQAGLPYIVVLTDPTTGGVTASFAMLGDIAIAEPGSVIGFAGLRVIEQTIRETLPDGFQRAEYLLDHGMIDMVVPRAQLRKTLARVIDLLMNKTRDPSQVLKGIEPDLIREESAGDALPLDAHTDKADKPLPPDIELDNISTGVIGHGS
ncbi:MAG: acetyl-CoA carboxylase, carboxyltransferase subunit beta [Rhodospirillaceae bacterium TMED8]|nr:acetyl-CoA carboxylase carboxyl transferase subunit beta [Magnetovibrio sp.]OUT49912.1 MAG: acetyl-CoA carboxylase, carboxyltransferase subunit beta [Rhodospirillaceae bacterium TMED8]|tara:strand:+ start:187 stop:1206 length:1020 start_codon:yes stop_codon:yes gene_type:complete